MKKICLIAILTILLIATFTSCGKPKEPLTSEMFNMLCDANSYECKDWSNNYTENPFIESVDKAHYLGRNWVEFYVYSDSASAKQATEDILYQLKASFTADGSGMSEKSKSSNNYSYCRLETEDEYAYVSQIDNTMLYVTVNTNDYISETEAFIEALGY